MCGHREWQRVQGCCVLVVTSEGNDVGVGNLMRLRAAGYVVGGMLLVVVVDLANVDACYTRKTNHTANHVYAPK